MRIEVNGATREVAGATVAEALRELGWDSVRVATALNGAFVPKGARDATAITAGDRLEVLAPMQGG
ncbi:sulfur carrier protein ThiS [Rhodobaculum claviforme]|uniref:Thiamine biosynthesis protein ThiS n=1 Tax=Rhodobaculum claviforme TaxID=1549854 RepID=A0A934WJ72_9RHOB|nr:sulfur carrier protein ThiS [Rhodobaculum claviforme]MBK5928875.1 thiamine biosynthesis protein ThiS [Rhodobaculum claviforme]